jgi:long-chain acyl-CoA synthetase
LNLASLIDPHPGARRALCDSTGWIDWAEVRRRARSVAVQLAELGVGPDDRVVLAWPTSIEFVVGYLGVLAAGAVVVPINPASPQAELDRELSFIDPKGVICGGPCRQIISGLLENRDPQSRPILLPAQSASTGSQAPGTTESEDDKLNALERKDSDLAVLLFTSGTSATARLAVLSHGNLISNLQQMLSVPRMMLGENDVGLAAIPFFHVFGLNVVLGMTLATGAALVCEERFDPKEALGLVVERKVTVVAGAPPMFADWAALPESDISQDSFSNVRLLVSGAAALPPEVADRFTARFGLPILQGYGLTEASPVVSTSVGLDQPSPGSVGRPLPGVSVRLVDESGEDALYDDPGEIWVRGPNIFHGYWHDDEATAQILDQEGWLHTGDVGVLDDAGNLYVVDRLKDIIIVSGFNVIPAEVERVIRTVNGVRDVVVVGHPDQRTGESVEAVVTKDPDSALSEKDIIDASRAHLAHYKVPANVRFVDALPHGLAGKALRRAVR